MAATMIHPLARIATRCPGAPFSHYEGRTTTCGELWQRVRRVGGALQAFQLAPGERVVHLGRPSDRLVEVVLGAALVNHPCVLAGPHLTLQALVRLVRRDGITTLFVDHAHLELGLALADRVAAIARIVVIDGADRLGDDRVIDHDWLVSESDGASACEPTAHAEFRAVLDEAPPEHRSLVDEALCALRSGVAVDIPRLRDVRPRTVSRTPHAAPACAMA